MDNSLENNTKFKEKLILFYNNNKYKIYLFMFVLLISIISIIAFNILKKKENNLMAEKYVQAGLYLASNNNKEAKNLYEEIINSKNKFYSILALNLIIEKNLITDQKKILDYFQLLEKINYSKDKIDLIKLKKALYLIKFGDKNSGNNILKNLVKENSTIGKISKQILE